MTRRQANVAGIVLAGGQGRRMGGVDKGWVELAGEPMIAHVLRRLAPQVDDILINANQHTAEYAAFGHRVIADTIGGFAGPLAGLQVGLANAAHSLVATVPMRRPWPPASTRPVIDRAGGGWSGALNWPITLRRGSVRRR